MDESIDTKPVLTDETAVEAVTDDAKGKDAAQEVAEKSAAEEPMTTSDDKETDGADEKMDADESAVEAAVDGGDAVEKATAADRESSAAPAVDESVDSIGGKGAEPAVEPVPDVALKSPSEAEKASPAPAIQSLTPPRSQGSKKPKVDLASVPVRQYLDTTVVPILLQGLSSLARERPQKPIAFLAQFLNDKASEYDE
ncbi:unnamed protein product [Oppiella nova]|uniref:Uncharacterized protein n=1 Tax=Oppiella nova TaxID=334625 RepID=A0A7R9MSL3_9ACAR|nr:unnamed protein product [Oppiella nova]CAG2181655.1 unnamed protein product [Oppiella nova]